MRRRGPSTIEVAVVSFVDFLFLPEPLPSSAQPLPMVSDL